MAHHQDGAPGRLRRAQSGDEVGTAVAGIENPRLDAGNAFQETIEVTSDDDFVARRVLGVERNQFLEQGESVPLRCSAIEGGPALCGDTGKADGQDEGEGKILKVKGQRSKGKSEVLGSGRRSRSKLSVPGRTSSPHVLALYMKRCPLTYTWT